MTCMSICKLVKLCNNAPGFHGFTEFRTLFTCVHYALAATKSGSQAQIGHSYMDNHRHFTPALVSEQPYGGHVCSPDRYMANVPYQTRSFSMSAVSCTQAGGFQDDEDETVSSSSAQDVQLALEEAMLEAYRLLQDGKVEQAELLVTDGPPPPFCRSEQSSLNHVTRLEPFTFSLLTTSLLSI